MAELDEDGVLHLTSSTQGTFHTRSELAKLFGRSIASVRVTGATLGGGFGGKLLILEPLAAAATLILRRPVRVELTRLEDFRMTNPAPAAILEVALGAHARRPAHRPARPAPLRDGRLRREQHRGDRRDPDRRPVPLGRPRDRGLRGRDQPGRHRRLPCARCAPGDVRPRTAARRAGRPPRAWTRSSSGAATWSPPTTRWPTAPRGEGSGSTNASSGWPTIRSTATGRRCPMARGSGSPSGRGPVAASLPRPSAASRPTAG